ncbi:MAG TPA: histidinol dehydrogenase [Smithellaceae bacterium]|nr:histidinol dehydrogenase [Smithellaceae bacterium]
MIKIIRAGDREFEKYFGRLRQRGGVFTPELLTSVVEIIQDVVVRGDEAVLQYTKQFDGYDLTAATMEATREETEEALASVSEEDMNVLRLAALRIEKYHRNQIVKGWAVADEEGVELGQRALPLRRVGIYAPGGKACYPSTILMAAIPAQLAGVEEIILVSPAKGGKLSPFVAAAALVTGVKRIFKIGGAQAIAALAYGTDTVPYVDKIVGPGNAYVAAAKKLVFGQVDIDMIAGPSEVVIIADQTADPTFAAADLLAQAEHDEMAASVLFTTEENLARAIAGEIEKRLPLLPKRDIAEKSLINYGAIIITESIEQAIALVNIFAPEHLELMLAEPARYLLKIRNAGSVFLGHFTPEALGDYLAGTNHILPTGGTARFSSPLGVYDFIKRMSVLSFSEAALGKLSKNAIYFARMEGLDAHANSVLVRKKEV